jgi:hypothetical protein
MLFRETIAVYSENHKKLIKKFCVQNAELLNVKAGGTLHTRFIVTSMLQRGDYKPISHPSPYQPFLIG